MSEPIPVPGHCGTCGTATNRLPCWNCELEQRIQQQNAISNSPSTRPTDEW